jgi:uncharacterized membrane protein
MNERVAAIDATRGIAMILMTLDHASSAFNAGRLTGDGAAMLRPGPIDPLQFAVRWVTHVCAPAFLLLAGMALALSIARRQARGDSGWSIDRDLLVRGLLLIVLEVCWMSWAWKLELGEVRLQVLYAIGASMIAMVALRRLPPIAVLLLAVALLFGSEALAHRLDREHVIAAGLVTGGRFSAHMVLYPVLPWLGFMALGFYLGGEIAAQRLRTWRPWGVLAIACAVSFVAIRAGNGYGNFDMLRGDDSLIAWLRLSKYPPSASYAAITLALVFAMLALFWRVASPRPLIVLGQAALFFYVLHVHLLETVAFGFGLHRACGLAAVMIGWVATVAVLYPLCAWYVNVKRRHPNSVLRFL